MFYEKDILLLWRAVRVSFAFFCPLFFNAFVVDLLTKIIYLIWEIYKLELFLLVHCLLNIL